MHVSVPGRQTAAAALLAAGVIAWAAAPPGGGAAGTRPALIAAVVAGALSITQPALAAVTARHQDSVSAADRAAQWLLAFLRSVPWAEIMIVGVLVLEALHPSRPWHTGLLAAGLVAYLLAVHLAEAQAGARVLRPQLPLLGAGAGLVALSVGAAALPGLPTGTAAGAIRIVAVLAVVVLAALAVPLWLRRGR